MWRRDWRSAARRAFVAALPVLLWQGHVLSVVSDPEYDRPAYSYQRAPYQFHNVSYAENMILMDTFAPQAGALTGGAVRHFGTPITGAASRPEG